MSKKDDSGTLAQQYAKLSEQIEELNKRRRGLVDQALEESGGVRAKAARLLRVNVRTIYRNMGGGGPA